MPKKPAISLFSNIRKIIDETRKEIYRTTNYIDPAYGPPGPDWYRRDEERGRDEEGAPRAEDVESRAEAGESRVTRGPFEPLRPGDREEAAQAGSQPGGDARRR